MFQSLTRTQKTILIIMGMIAFVVIILAAAVVIKNMPPAAPQVNSPSQTFSAEILSTDPAIIFTPSAIPGTPTATPFPTPIVYTVQSGDTLTSIAELFGVTVADLFAWNQLASDVIQPGWQLTVTAPMAELFTPTVPATEAILASTATATSGLLAQPTTHPVSSEDTLESIASRYQLTPADLRRANFMVGDALLPGTRLVIPVGPAPEPVFQFSILEGDLFAAYPQVFQAARLTLHTAPNTYPAVDPEGLASLELRALEHIENLFKARLEGHFDVFVAGSVFQPPNRTLRGRSFSLNRQTLFLHDGTGNTADQYYIATHELTHLFSWNVFGAPVSTMLSEGAAVYSGMEAIRGQGHLPVETFCAAYLQAGQLPRVSGSLSFEGHILDLQNYYAAGCFVGYLIEAYDPYNFARLYPSGDFEAVYDQSASNLEDEWRGVLALESIPVGLSPERLVSSVSRMERTYLNFFSAFSGTPAQLEAYRELDLARLALLAGDLDAFDAQMILYEAALQAP